MKRIHNTISEKIIFKSVTQSRENSTGIGKPCGLWYGIDEAWLSWCRDNETDWIKPNNFEVKVNSSKILVLKNTIEVLEFCNQYIYEMYPRLFNINWAQVAKKYSGIEIHPYERIYYHREKFGEFIWHNGWDCSSGCIWHEDAVKSIKKIETNLISIAKSPNGMVADC